MKRKFLVTTVTLFITSAAQAIPVQWKLQDVTFEDGGAATGSFVFDADTNTYSEISIATTSGTISAGASYSDLLNPFPGPLTVRLWAPDATPRLDLRFSVALTNSGGTVPLLPGVLSSFEYDCVTADAECTTFVSESIRLVTGGAVTGQVIPVPAALWLFGSALGLLGWLKRRAI